MYAISARGVVGCDALRAGDSIASLSICLLPTRADFRLGSVAECQVGIQPERPCVIGRTDGYHVPYLAEGYRSSPIVPTSGEAILWGSKLKRDNFVSRAHFMLKAAGGGIVLVNGVPGRDGNLRPPPNGTFLVEPVSRRFGAGEEYWIGSGSAVLVRLPNRMQIRIQAG